MTSQPVRPFTGVSFSGPLQLGYLSGESWRLLKPLTCTWAHGWVVAPAGFKTDLSSVPQIFRSLLPQVGEQNTPAVIHDWLYSQAPQGWRRKDADDLFLAALAALGVGWLKRYAMWLGVRAGGWTVWRARRRGDQRDGVTLTRL